LTDQLRSSSPDRQPNPDLPRARSRAGHQKIRKVQAGNE
jgi:hypothetical protein